MLNFSAFVPIFLLLSPALPGNHAIYLSVVEVNHNIGTKNASIKIKVFTNDIEDALLNALNHRINLSDSSSCINSRASVENYFSKHLLFSINGKNAVLSLTGCEINGDAVWFNFSVDCESQWKLISVTANYLMELFPTQSNVVTINSGGEKRFIRLTKSKSTETVKF